MINTIRRLIVDWKFRARRLFISLFSGEVPLKDGSFFIVNNDGSWRRWYNKDRIIHNENGPAAESIRRTREYYINGIHIPQLDGKKIYGKGKVAKYASLV